MRTKRSTCLAALALLALANPLHARIHSLNAAIDGAQAAAGAGTGSPGTGFARLTFDDVTNVLTWRIEWSGLQGDVTNMHFHGPAGPGVDAGVAVSITDQTSPSEESATLSAGQASDLLDGLYYINIHTSAFGGGEVRGQVLPAEKLVELDAAGLPAGDLASWGNAGTLGGEFVGEIASPVVESVGGANAVSLNGSDSWMIGPDTPESVTGTTSKAIGAWVLNDFADDEETIFSWGRRGGGEGTNLSFNHGLNATFGAVGHWGAPDVGWSGDLVETAWTQVYYVYDADLNRTTVFTDGALSTSETHGVVLNTHATDSLGGALPFVLGNQNEADGTRVAALSGSMAIAKLVVYDDVISPEQIASDYVEEAPAFGVTFPVIRSFTSSVIDPANVRLSWQVLGEESLSIDNDIGDVTGMTSVDVALPVGGTVTYTLTATGGGNSVTAEVMVDALEPVEPIHQWRFSESGGAGTELVDSIGGQNGLIVDVGANDASVGLGQVTLTGGAKASSDYVEFPGGLLDGLVSATIETWATMHSVQNWGRVFSFGSGDGNTAGAWHLAWTRGTGQNTQRFEPQTLGPADSDLVTEFDQEYHIVAIWDAEGGTFGDGEIRWYRDGVLAASLETGGFLTLEFDVDDTVMWLGRSQWPDNTANASWNELRIYDVALSEAQIQFNFNNPPVDEDRDSDGLPNDFEELFAFLDPDNPADAGMDQDNDQLTNLQEYEVRTNLEVADTDDDGLDDGAELALAPPTDPLDPDSDDDGLLDGAEVTVHGTMPLNPDSDSDLISDGLEVARGSNPLDPTSTPDPLYPELANRWSFSETGGLGTTLVDSVGGQNGTIVENFNFDDGFVGDGQVTLLGGANLDAAFVEFPAGLLEGKDSVTIETWATPHAFLNWGRVFSFGSTIVDTVIDVWQLAWAQGTNGNTQRLEAQSVGPADSALVTDFDQEYHIVAIWDGAGGANGGGQYRWYRDGLFAAAIDTGAVGLDTIDDEALWLGRSRWGADSTANASWNEFRIWNGVLSEVEIFDSLQRGPDNLPGEGGGGGDTFLITSFSYDAGSDSYTLVWQSEDGKSYNIYWSPDMQSWPRENEVADNVPATGDSTFFSVPAQTLPGADTYIRVEESGAP